MSASAVFITGGNAGLGLEIVRALLGSAKTYTVYLGSRSMSNAQNAIKTLQEGAPSSKSTVKPVEIDVASDQSIQVAFSTISAETDRLDVIINNAGVSLDGEISQGKSSVRDAFNKMWDVNVVGSHIVTETFIPLLLKSQDPRLVFMTSGTSSIDEASRGLPYTAAKPPAGWPKPPAWGFTGYRSSKAGLNMLTAEWGRILKEDKVKIWAISPGFLATGLAGAGAEKLKEMGAKDPSEGAEFVRDVIEGGRDADVGKAIRSDGVQPW